MRKDSKSWLMGERQIERTKEKDPNLWAFTWGIHEHISTALLIQMIIKHCFGCSSSMCYLGLEDKLTDTYT